MTIYETPEAEKFLWQVCKCKELLSKDSHDEDMIEISSITDARVPLEHKSINQVCFTSPHRVASSSSVETRSWIKDNKATTFVLPPCEWDEMLHIRWGLNLRFKDDWESLPQRIYCAVCSLWFGILLFQIWQEAKTTEGRKWPIEGTVIW